MGYDCSIKKRKGCNYCTRYKTIMKNEIEGNEIWWVIDDDEKELQALTDGDDIKIRIKINYCPICGKELE